MVLDNLAQMGKIGLGMFVLGTVFFLVGFSVPYWLVSTINSDVHIGLWEVCGGDYCRSTVSDDFNYLDTEGSPSWYRGTQALACLALIALMADFALRLLFLCGKPKIFLLGSIAMDCTACVLAILAAVVFGTKADSIAYFHFHFGFAFNIIGAIFLAFTAFCFLAEYCRRR